MASRDQDPEAIFSELLSSDIDWSQMRRPTPEDEDFFMKMQVDPEQAIKEWKERVGPEEAEGFDEIINYHQTKEEQEMAGLAAMRERQKAAGGGNLRVCEGGDCPGEGKLRCTGCFMANYCGVECQRKAWKKHKNPCKLIRVMYKPVTLSHKSGEMYVADMNKVMQNQVTKYNPPRMPSRSQFLVKVCVGQSSMFVSNEEGSVHGSLFRQVGQEEVYDMLRRQIGAMGFEGRKAFFSAIYKSDTYEEGCKLEINAEVVLPVEVW